MKKNEHETAIGFFDAIPKSVIAAMLVSRLSDGGDHLEDQVEEIREWIADEWQALYAAGVVSQEPARRVKRHSSRFKMLQGTGLL